MSTLDQETDINALASEHHVMPLRIYYGVFGALVALTVVTVGVSYANLGPASIYIALLVAFIKAGFVVGYFMHLKYDTRFHQVIFFGSSIFLGLLFVLTFLDISTRAEVNPETGNEFLSQERLTRERETAFKKTQAKAAPTEAPKKAAPKASAKPASQQATPAAPAAATAAPAAGDPAGDVANKAASRATSKATRKDPGSPKQPTETKPAAAAPQVTKKPSTPRTDVAKDRGP